MGRKKKETTFQDLTYNKTIYGLTGGFIEKGDVLKEYNRARNRLMKQIREINKSEVKFRRSENIPSIPTAAKLSKSGSLEDISHAVADVNRLLKTATVEARRGARQKALTTLKDRMGGVVNEGNFNQFADFMEWFRENMVNQLLDSKDNVVEEFIRDRAGKRTPASKRSWARIFVKWLWDNGYDEQAQEIGEMFFASYRRK